MTKDYKTGLVIGLALVIMTAVWLSIHPSLSVGSRLKDLNDKQAQQEQPDVSKIIKENNKQENNQKSIDQIQETAGQENKELPNTTNQQTGNERSKEIEGDFQSEIVVPFKLNETKFHTVVKDDTLIRLAEQYYGSAKKWTKIRDANPRVDVYKLQPGTQLIIPPP